MHSTNFFNHSMRIFVFLVTVIFLTGSAHDSVHGAPFQTNHPVASGLQVAGNPLSEEMAAKIVAPTEQWEQVEDGFYDGNRVNLYQLGVRSGKAAPIDYVPSGTGTGL